MARADGRYIQFYTAGSAAEDLASALRVEETPKSRPRRSRKPVLYIDPVAIFGMVTAVVLTLCVLIAFGQLNAAKAEYDYVHEYNCQLKQEHKDLETLYAASYDKEEVRLEAVLMGYVPSSQLKHVTIKAAEPAPVQEQPTALQQAWIYLTELFA